MSEEEIEAIEYFKDDIKFLEQELKNPNYLGRYITIHTKEFNYLKTLLNLIKKQQQELNKEKEKNIELEKKLEEYRIGWCNEGEKSEKLYEEIRKLQELLEERN